MAHLFFSYAHNDQERLIPFQQRIEVTSGHKIWIDRLNLERDDKWAAMIERAITSSYGVIFAVTKEFVNEPERWFIHQHEIPWSTQRFNNEHQGKLLFIVRFDDVPLPAALMAANLKDIIYTVDAFNHSWEDVITELVKVFPPPKDSGAPFMVSWPRLTNFQGRKQQLIDLHNSLFTEDGKVGIKTAGMYGMGGIGKTQLAVEYAYRYRFYFDKGVFWLNAADSWQAEMVRFADSLGLKPADETDTNNREGQKVIALANYLAGKEGEALLVMDNVDNPAAVLNREIGPKLTIAQFLERARARLLITTRVRDLPASFGRVEVSVLDRDDARAVLLDAWQPDAHGTRRTDTPNFTTLDAIAELFGRLPLPLGWMAAALRQKNTMQPEKLLENLKKQGVDETITRLKANKVDLGTPEHYAALVSAGLDWQLAQVDNPNALDLLTLIAAYGEAAIVPIARLKLLVTLDEDDLFDPMAEATAALIRYSLVEPQAEGNAFRLHPLTRDYVARKYNASQRLAEAAEKLVRSYRTPQVIHDETTQRGFAEVLNDLTATQGMLAQPLAELDKLARFFTLDAHKLIPLPDNAQESYIIQTVRDRAHHQNDVELQKTCDDWLKDKPHLRALEASRYPATPNLLRTLQIHYAEGVGVLALDNYHILSWESILGSTDRESMTMDIDAQNLIKVLATSWTTNPWQKNTEIEEHIMPRTDKHALRLWSVKRHDLSIFEGHTGMVNGAQLLSDGRILSWSTDHTLRIWSASGEWLNVLEGHTGTVNGAQQLSDGRILSWSTDHTLRIWSASGEWLNVLEGHTGTVNGAQQLSDGRILSWSSGFYKTDHVVLCLRDTQGKVLNILREHLGNVVGAMELNNGTLLSWSSEGTLHLWSKTGEPLSVLQGHTSSVNNVLELDDQRLLSWSNDSTFRLWDPSESQSVLDGHWRSVDGLLELANGQIVSWSDDDTLRLWNIDGEPLSVLQGHTGVIYGATQLDDGHILSWSMDGTLRVWDIDGEPLSVLQGHTGVIYGATQLDDGHILSWSMDGTLRLWSRQGKSVVIFQEQQSHVGMCQGS